MSDHGWAHIQAYEYADLDGLRGTLHVNQDDAHAAVIFQEEGTGTLYLLDLLMLEDEHA